MSHYRYLRCVRDVPEHNLREGDLIEIGLGVPDPIRSYRAHGYNHGAFLGLEADGALIPLDGVLGLVPRRESSPQPPGVGQRPQAG